MNKERRETIKKCKEKLTELMSKHLVTLSSKASYHTQGGEIIDMANSEVQMQDSIFFRGRIRSTLVEIRDALKRIDDGTYGYCELSGDEIESKRLIAVPWTRVSMKALESERAS